MHPRKKRILNSDYKPPEGYPYVEITEEMKQEIRKLEVQIPANNVQTDTDFPANPNREFIGLCGEWAFSEYYNLEYKAIGPSGDDGIDYEIKHLPSGETGTIDIKTSPVRDCNLLNPEYMELRSDAYILIEKRGNYFSFIGTATKEMMQSAQVIKEGNRGMKVDTIFINRDDLNPVPNPDELVSA